MGGGRWLHNLHDNRCTFDRHADQQRRGTIVTTKSSFMAPCPFPLELNSSRDASKEIPVAPSRIPKKSMRYGTVQLIALHARMECGDPDNPG